MGIETFSVDGPAELLIIPINRQENIFCFMVIGRRASDKSLNTLILRKPKTLEKIVSMINQNFVILRFCSSMNQFVGVNMNK